MKVSIITVSFNAYGTIRDTLKSVAEQDYPDIEYIVMDGASTDGTLDIIREYGSHIAQFVSEPDGGIYDAMNKAWKLATGDLVGFIHADDFFSDPSCIRRIVEAQQVSGADIVFADVAMVAADDTTKLVRFYSPQGFNLSWLKQGYAPPFPGIYCRRELFDKFGGYDVQYPLAGDFDWLARILFVHKTNYAILPYTVVKMRVGGKSSGIRSNIQGYREIARSCKINGVPATPLTLMSRFFSKALQYSIFQRGGKVPV